MSKRDCCIIGLLAVWFLTSLAALAGMYHLWWTRERILYLGKPVYAQQAALFQRAGLPLETLDLAKKVDAAWPTDIDYKALGSEVSLSYLKYLILPRTPSGSSEYRLVENRHEYSFSPETQGSRRGFPFSTLTPTPRGFLISLAIVLLAAMGLNRFGLSVPEGGACVALVLGILTIISKGLFHSIDAAGWIMVVLASVGALILLCHRNLLANNKHNESNRGIVLLAAIFVLLGAIVWSFLMAVVVGPDDWDAWAQWGPKAKILALSGGSLSDVRYFVHGSGDYPLLWPALWAFSGWCAGGWEEQWSKAWGPLFLLLTVWQMGTLTLRFTGRMDVGWLTTALFVSMPAVPLVASWAYAEAPLWLFLVCATGRMLLWQQSGRRTDLLLAGLFAAGAACTKNEGVLFAALSALWVIGNSRRVRDLFLFIFPSLLSYGLWKAYTLLHLNISNRAVKALETMDWMGNQWFDTLSAAGIHILRIWSDVRQWNIVLPVLLLMAGWLLLRGQRQDRINLLLTAVFLAGLLVVVLSHGQDWSWQLGAAWNRLTIQGLAVLIPVVVCGCGRHWMRPDGTAR